MTSKHILWLLVSGCFQCKYYYGRAFAFPSDLSSICVYSVLTGIHLATGGEGVATVALGAAAGGHPVAYLAIGIHAASARARVDALSVPADLRASALVVVQTAAAMAVGQRIALVAGRARAHGPSTDRLLATGPRSARTTRTSRGYGEGGSKRFNGSALSDYTLGHPHHPFDHHTLLGMDGGPRCRLLY